MVHCSWIGFLQWWKSKFKIVSFISQIMRISFHLVLNQCRYQVSLVGVPIRNSLPSDSTRRPSGDGSLSRMHSGAVSAPGAGASPNTMPNCSMDKTAPKEESNLQILVFVVMACLPFANPILRIYLLFFSQLPQLVSPLLEENGP